MNEIKSDESNFNSNSCFILLNNVLKLESKKVVPSRCSKTLKLSIFQMVSSTNKPTDDTSVVLPITLPKKTKGKLSKTGMKFYLLMIFGSFLVCDLVLTIMRRRYFQRFLPMVQSLLHQPGSDGTFAQNYQDVWFMKLAKHNNWTNVKNGFFLDIGAYNGIWCSNSKLLEIELNWGGACVDFRPHSFEDRKCMVFQNAMSGETGKEVSFIGTDQERKISFRGSSGVGGVGGNSDSSSTSLRTISFPDLLKQSNAPSFIPLVSLDVEGHELEVLKSFQWDKVEVGAWIIENPVSEIKKLLYKNEYKERYIMNRGVDGYFVKDKFWDPKFDDELREKKWREHPFFSFGC